MPDLTPAELATLQARIDRSPALQAYLRRPNPSGTASALRSAPALVQAKARGEDVPDVPPGYTINRATGRLEKDWGFGKYALAAGLAAAPVAGVLAAPAIAGALGGHAGVAGAGAAGAGAASTGGAVGSSLWGRVLPWVGRGADALADLARGRSVNNQNRASQQLVQDQQRQQLYEAMQRNQLDRSRQIADRAKFQLEAPSARADQAATGDVMANIQDMRFPDNPRVHVMHPTGGLRPSLLGPNARAAGAALSALGSSQLGKDTYDIPDLLPPPPLSHLADPGGGVVGDILGGASVGARFLDELMKRRQGEGVSTNFWDY